MVMFVILAIIITLVGFVYFWTRGFSPTSDMFVAGECFCAKVWYALTFVFWVVVILRLTCIKNCSLLSISILKMIVIAYIILSIVSIGFAAILNPPSGSSTDNSSPSPSASSQNTHMQVSPSPEASAQVGTSCEVESTSASRDTELLTNAKFTSAIVHETDFIDCIFDSIVCRYVFLDQQRERRYPEKRDFKEGELAQLLERNRRIEG